MPELSRVITSLLGGMTDRPGVDVNNKFSKSFFATPLGDILLYTKEKCKIISRYYQRTYDLWDTWFSGILPPQAVLDTLGQSACIRQDYLSSQINRRKSLLPKDLRRRRRRAES